MGGGCWANGPPCHTPPSPGRALSSPNRLLRHRVPHSPPPPRPAPAPPQVLLELTDGGAWIVPRLQGSEAALKASMAASGFAHPLVEYIPRVATSGAGTPRPTACPCGPQSLAVRLPGADAAFGPPAGAAAAAAAPGPVHVGVGVAAAVLTRARRLVADMNLTRGDCCAFDAVVDVQWRLQGPDGGHLLEDLLRAGQAEVVGGRRLVVAPSALAGHAAPYTVGVVARDARTAEVLGMGLREVTVVAPPPRGVFTVVPASGMCGAPPRLP